MRLVNQDKRDVRAFWYTALGFFTLMGFILLYHLGFWAALASFSVATATFLAGMAHFWPRREEMMEVECLRCGKKLEIFCPAEIARYKGAVYALNTLNVAVVRIYCVECWEEMKNDEK